MASKRPGSSASAGPSVKRKRSSLTLEQKLEIINRAESGEGASALGRCYNLGESTIRNIKKNADKIRSAVIHSSHLSSKVATKVRNPLMEKMLNLYIEHENKKKQPLSNSNVRAKALKIYERLCREEGRDPTTESFNASTGWYARFIKRHNLHNLKVRGEQGSADHEAATRYKDELQRIVEEFGFSQKQVFNADETGLFWKRMPQRTYISKEEKIAPGFKAAKDRLTLLLCGNAEGDFKMKPLLVYHSLNPRALKGLSKNMLPVHWAANKKAWVTGQLFEDWFTNHFAVEAEHYCREQNLAFKVLLLLDNAPGHPKHLDSIHPNITVRYLPPNTTSLIQPLDQGVISTFKAYYLRRTFSQMLDDTDDFEEPGSKPTIREWWKAYTIREAINNIDASWKEVKSSTVNASWKHIWEEAVHTFTGFPSFATTVEECVTLGRRVGGEGFSDMEADDVIELIDSHNEPLSVDDLLQLSQVKEKEEEEEEEVELQVKAMTMKTMAKFFKMAEELNQFAMDMDYSLERSQHFGRIVQSALAPYKEIYAQKQNAARQTTMTKFFTSKSATPTPPPPQDSTPTPTPPPQKDAATTPTPPVHSTPVATPTELSSPSPASSEVSLHLPESSSHDVSSPQALPDLTEDPDDPPPLSM